MEIKRILESTGNQRELQIHSLLVLKVEYPEDEDIIEDLA